MMSLPKGLGEDAEALSRAIGYTVSLHPDESRIFVVVSQAALPVGTYSKVASDVLLATDFQYPMSLMDMFYMEPDVRHANRPLPNHAANIEEHVGRPWRRWSWHRNGIWTPGKDNLLTHWAFVESCWAKESVS